MGESRNSPERKSYIHHVTQKETRPRGLEERVIYLRDITHRVGDNLIRRLMEAKCDTFYSESATMVTRSCCVMIEHDFIFAQPC